MSSITHSRTVGPASSSLARTGRASQPGLVQPGQDWSEPASQAQSSLARTGPSQPARPISVRPGLVRSRQPGPVQPGQDWSEPVSRAYSSPASRAQFSPVRPGAGQPPSSDRPGIVQYSQVQFRPVRPCQARSRLSQPSYSRTRSDQPVLGPGKPGLLQVSQAHAMPSMPRPDQACRYLFLTKNN